MRASRWIVVAVGLVVVVIGVAVVILTDDSSGPSHDDPSNGGTIPANYQNYHQVQFGIAITNSWPRDKSDRRPRVGDYLESIWRYPANPAARVTVYSRSSDGSTPPAAAANLAQAQTRGLPDYEERGLKAITLRGHPAVRWNFALSDAIYLEYFLEECGVSLIFRGSAPRSVWPELSSIFDDTAKSITAKCKE
jgi:hypothetical protein